jgi:hypothetical protein
MMAVPIELRRHRPVARTLPAREACELRSGHYEQTDWRNVRCLRAFARGMTASMLDNVAP